MRLPRSCRRPLFLFAAIFAVLVTTGAWAATSGLSDSPTSLRFGSVAVGQSETQTVVLTNKSSGSVTISAVAASNSVFKISGMKLPLTLAAGKSAVAKVTFTPTQDGWLGGTITITSTASNPSLGIPLGGVGVKSDPLTLSPASLSFGQVAVGSQVTLSVVVTNPHSWSESLQGLQIGGTGFSATGPLPVTLASGKSVTLHVTYSPKSAGLSAGRVFILGPSMSVPLTGTGSAGATLAVSPDPLNFGKVMVGIPSTQTLILSAHGGPVTISSAASSSSQFVLAGLTLPLTINAGQTAQFHVVFTPTASGTASAKLSLLSNATDSPDVEPLSGTGTPPQVSLDWSPSTSPVQGYNIYRGPAPGSYAKLNSALNTSTSYTDTSVVGRKTYYYAATAVSSSGQESGYSSPVKVVIP